MKFQISRDNNKSDLDQEMDSHIRKITSEIVNYTKKSVVLYKK
jgi:hypothetical protein